MEINLYRPKNETLQQFIEYFYTLKRSIDDENTLYLAFPNTFTIISTIKDVEVTSKHNFERIVHSPNGLIETDLVCDFNEPVLIQYEGKANEVVVLFKPLGINAFLDKDLDIYNKGDFPPFADYDSTLTKILSLSDDESTIGALEDYWLSKLKGFEHPFLYEVIDDLMSEETPPLTISELASKHRISRVTLTTHFKRHICKTPTQFRKIVRFRNAMKRHANKSPQHQLTDLTYAANYFDQSHMIKDFKALTGYSPKTFFSKISKIENGELSWLFV